MIFDWDENKNQINQKKHGISARKATAMESKQYHDMTQGGI
jgi:uncharacterized DUF497 family protein